MFGRLLTWRERATIAEAELEATREALRLATEQLDGIELRFRQRAALVSITREGRTIKWRFLRNGELIDIATFGTWDDDVEGWKRQLLEKLP